MTKSWLSEELQFIAVEGGIGVGKTSFVQLLGAQINAKLILEPVEENPFLFNFYKDPKRYAFQTQLFFLLSRFKQQQEMAGSADLFNPVTVSDYLFDKDKIFASLNLDVDELDLYRIISKSLESKVIYPDLVIYLQAGPKNLIKKIKRRNRAFEREISEDYIRELVEAYDHFFFHYHKTPLLIVDTNEIDFVKNSEDMAQIVKELVRAPIRGTQYFRPLSREGTLRTGWN